MERVMLGLRLAEGLEVRDLAPRAVPVAEEFVGDGLLDPSAWATDRLVLTDRGRLLADAVIRDLVSA
jgi:oxygen-independent coproporphyrinogen-3 oxidase